MRPESLAFESSSFRGPASAHSAPEPASHIAVIGAEGWPVSLPCSRNAHVGTGGELVRAPSRVERRSTRWKRPLVGRTQWGWARLPTVPIPSTGPREPTARAPQYPILLWSTVPRNSEIGYTGDN